MTVSGLTMISASGQSFQSLERQTQKRRSRRRSFGRLSERLRTRSCCRRTRISAASDSLETNRDRKNRKYAEKMAIRVERSISDEGDGQENRIAASSAKCKGNKAGWSFYQGQGSRRPVKRHSVGAPARFDAGGLQRVVPRTARPRRLTAKWLPQLNGAKVHRGFRR